MEFELFDTKSTRKEHTWRFAREICRILGTEFYSGGGGDRLGFFRGGIIYNGLGKQIGFARNVTTLEVAIYLFFLSN